MTSLSSWQATMTTLAANIAARSPDQEKRCDEIADKARQIAELWPLVSSCTDQGDGLRSPNLQGGSRSKGGHADIPGMVATARADFERFDSALRVRDDGDRKRVVEPTNLAYPRSLCEDAEDSLRRALSEVEE